MITMCYRPIVYFSIRTERHTDQHTQSIFKPNDCLSSIRQLHLCCWFASFIIHAWASHSSFALPFFPPPLIAPSSSRNVLQFSLASKSSLLPVYSHPSGLQLCCLWTFLKDLAIVMLRICSYSIIVAIELFSPNSTHYIAYINVLRSDAGTPDGT